MRKFYFLTVLFSAFSFLSFSQAVTTFAGNGSTSLCNNGTQKLQCSFSCPWGLAIDSKGRIWVTEEGMSGLNAGHTIKVILADGTVYTRAGAYGMPGYKDGFGAGTTRFSSPRGIAVGPGDTIYIADCGNHLIRKLAPFLGVGSSQEVTVFAGSHDSGGGTPGYVDGPAGTAKFNQPSDLAVDNSGNVYVVEEGNHCVRMITPDGTVSTFAGTPKDAGYQDGGKLSAKFNYPTGIYLASNGDIYIADNFGSRVRKISGSVVTTVGNVTNPPLYQPNDVALDGNGILYVTDEHRVFKFVNSVISDFAGPHDPSQPGNINALGTAARFNNVKGIVVDPSNNNIIYVADQGNNLVKKILICTLAKPVIVITGNLLTCSVSAASYKWYKDEILISGATNKTYNVTQTGDYKVEITDINGCTSTSDAVHKDVSSLIEFNKSISLEIYPNPSTGMFDLTINSLKPESISLIIYDMMGNCIYRKEYQVTTDYFNDQVDLSNFRKGIYFVRVRTAEYSGVVRLVLE